MDELSSPAPTDQTVAPPRDTGLIAETRVRTVASWVFVIGAGLLTACTLALMLLGARHDPDFYAVAVRHFPTVVGLPFAAIASLFIVIACRVVAGEKLTLKVLGLELSGASGPVVLWIVCFLAMTVAIESTWDKAYTGPLSRHLSSWLDHSSSLEQGNTP
jgi:hypothetical protein